MDKCLINKKEVKLRVCSETNIFTKGEVTMFVFNEKVKELQSIKKFRGGNLGIIRLNKLAYPNDITIKIGDEEFRPVGYDTYGHPIISEENVIYYKALKAIKERQDENLVPEVEYIPQPFCVKREIYDSKECIQKVETEVAKTEESETEADAKLKRLKQLLIYRKKAHFNKMELNTFILYGRYALYEDGHVYLCTYQRKNQDKPEEMVLELSEVDNFELGEEVHIPRHEDVCFICRRNFNINDVEEFTAIEDENGRKAHKRCLTKYTEAREYQQASQIIDSVYHESTESEIIREYDEEDKKEKVWYLYHTKQGDVAIRFKKKVIAIKWFGNFKPFNLEKLFEGEDVTKIRHEDAKEIHAWGVDYAIRYLSMVKKA